MKEYIRFIKTRAVPPGKAAVKMISGVPIYVINKDGVFYAYVAVCPHKFHILSIRELINGYIICPGHKEKFDPFDGSPKLGLSKISLKNLDVKIKDSEVYVEKPSDELRRWLIELTE